MKFKEKDIKKVISEHKFSNYMFINFITNYCNYFIHHASYDLRVNKKTKKIYTQLSFYPCKLKEFHIYDCGIMYDYLSSDKEQNIKMEFMILTNLIEELI